MCFALLTAVAFLFWQAVVPTGKITYAIDFSQENFFIGKLKPAERLATSSPGQGSSVIGDPVYFTLRTPRRFDKARITLAYRNSAAAPIVEIGPLVDKTVWRYKLAPVDNSIIDNLSKSWKAVRSQGILFMQNPKARQFASLEDFLENPEFSQTAAYNYDLKSRFLISDYRPLPQQPREISARLRGAWQAYTYVKGESFDFKFQIVDLNQNKDPDGIDVILYADDAPVQTWHLEDDGITEDKGKVLPARTLEARLDNLPEGVYKLEFKANDDIQTDRIFAAQKKFALIGKFRLNSLADLVTDSDYVSAQTTNPASLQTIQVGNSRLEISQTYRQYSADTGSSTSDIKIPKGDVILAGNRAFAFSRDEFFDPQIRRVDRFFDAARQNINYVIADYATPRMEDGYLVSESEIDLTGAYREKGAYSFMISLPGLNAAGNSREGVEILSIKIELSGKSLLEWIGK